MAITKFKITKLPIRATLKVGGVAVVLNQEYSLSQQYDLVSHVTSVGYPYDSFDFKVGNNNNVWSEEKTCVINVNVGTGAPVLSGADLSIKLNEITDISSLFAFDANTDRIKFTALSSPNYGKVLINQIELVIDKVYFLYEFLNPKWSSIYTGLTPNVSQAISFQVGNKTEWSAVYVLNLISSANLQGVSDITEDESTLVVGTLTTV